MEQASSGEQADAFTMLVEMVATMAEFPLDTVRHSLDLHAPPLVGAFAFLMSVAPVLALTMGYDQCASDIETRHARYLAFRIDRTTLYLGKLLGAWGIISLTIATAAISMAGYIWVRAGTIPSVGDLAYVVRIIATVSMSTLPLLTLLGLLGTLRGRARRVALLAILLWLVVGLASAAARHGLEVEWLADAIDVLWPTNGRWALLLDEGTGSSRRSASLPTAWSSAPWGCGTFGGATCDGCSRDSQPGEDLRHHARPGRGHVQCTHRRCVRGGRAQRRRQDHPVLGRLRLPAPRRGFGRHRRGDDHPGNAAPVGRVGRAPSRRELHSRAAARSAAASLRPAAGGCRPRTPRPRCSARWPWSASPRSSASA